MVCSRSQTSLEKKRDRDDSVYHVDQSQSSRYKLSCEQMKPISPYIGIFPPGCSGGAVLR